MTAPQPGPFQINRDERYFSLEGYRAILLRARESGYRITPFRDWSPPVTSPVLLLRHDLDHALEPAMVVAELESELGLCSTFFVQVACEFYNLLSPSSRQLIRRLADLGHEIGLHYESRRYAHDPERRHLLCDLQLLEDLCGHAIQSAAEHIPIDGFAISLSPHIHNEAYEPRFTTTPPMHYVSDSLMAWRQVTPHDLLDQRESLQLLTHPETWTTHAQDVEEVLRTLLAEEIQAARLRYDRAIAYYAKIFGERAERDQAFRRRRVARERMPEQDAGRRAARGNRVLP
jgi:hypothetical protein